MVSLSSNESSRGEILPKKDTLMKSSPSDLKIIWSNFLCCEIFFWKQTRLLLLHWKKNVVFVLHKNSLKEQFFHHVWILNEIKSKVRISFWKKKKYSPVSISLEWSVKFVNIICFYEGIVCIKACKFQNDVFWNYKSYVYESGYAYV